MQTRTMLSPHIFNYHFGTMDASKDELLLVVTCVCHTLGHTGSFSTREIYPSEVVFKCRFDAVVQHFYVTFHEIRLHYYVDSDI